MSDLIAETVRELARDDRELGPRSALRRITPESGTSPAPEKAREFPPTDSGNAEAFAADVGSIVCHDHARREWFVFTGHRFEPNTTAQVDRLALETIRRMQISASLIASDTKRKAALRWAVDSENRSRRDNLLACAAKIKELADAGDRWDATPGLFSVQNGILELDKGRLRPGRPEDRITKASPVIYDAAAACDRWEQFLAQVFADHPEIGPYLQRVIGYALTGLTTEQQFWILYGLGANGKSTLIETLLHHIFGSRGYAWAMPFPGAGWSNSMSEYQKAGLMGRRFVTASEVTRRGHLNEELIKSLTGDDTINARHPYGRPFQFVPVAKFFLRVNEKPVIRDESHGMWRRVKLIEFSQTFSVDTTLAATLAAEAPGILAWAVRGAVDWFREGLCEPACVQAATNTYREESDPLADFFHERCVILERARVGGRELFTAYRQWCDARQMPADERMGQKVFGLRIREKHPNVGTARKAIYGGIGLQGTEGLDFTDGDAE